jgi:tRNA(fMet)-specific endonuclease VapC
MSVRYLLDTNTASYIIKGNVPRVYERLLRVPMADVGISVLTEAELRFGAALKPESQRLNVAVEDFLLHVEVLPWDSEAAKHYASLRVLLEREGKPVGTMDLLIAAHAMAAGAILVTHDRVFGRVRGLKQVDWTQ